MLLSGGATETPGLNYRLRVCGGAALGQVEELLQLISEAVGASTELAMLVKDRIPELCNMSIRAKLSAANDKLAHQAAGVCVLHPPAHHPHHTAPPHVPPDV